MKFYIGIGFLILPLIGMWAHMAYTVGLTPTIIAWGLLISVVGCVAFGVWLILDNYD